MVGGGSRWVVVAVGWRRWQLVGGGGGWWLRGLSERVVRQTPRVEGHSARFGLLHYPFPLPDPTIFHRAP